MSSEVLRSSISPEMLVSTYTFAWRYNPEHQDQQKLVLIGEEILYSHVSAQTYH